MTLIDDYLEYQEKYAQEYGERTCVLMQVGHFYECYAVDNHKEKSNSENIYRLADLLNIQLTRKNKKIIENSRGNPLMIGVNLFSINKYIQLLLNNSYTTVLIDQVTEPPEPERKVTNIYSPGTNIDHTIKGDTNNLVTIYIDVIKNASDKTTLFIGLTAIDVSTGKNTVYETYSSIEDKNYSLDETFRFIQVYDPKEIAIYLNNNESNDLTEHFLSSYLDLSQRVTHFKDIEKHFLNINYQNTLLKKVYPNHGLLSVIEYVDLETKPYGTIAFTLALDFAYRHNEKVINAIEKPQVWDKNNYLILTNNSINQLNIVSHPAMNTKCHYNSLFAVINNTSTSFGKRKLRDTLLNPIIDTEKLNSRYTIQEAFMKDNLYSHYENHLNHITDIERLHRKITLGLIQPADFVGLDISYEKIKKILEIENPIINELKPNKHIISNFYLFVNEYRDYFNLEEIYKYHIDKINDSFFNKGKYDNIDTIKQQIDNDIQLFNDIANVISNLIEENSSFVHFESNERDGYFLTLTSKRAETLKKKFKNTKHYPLEIQDQNNTIVNPKEIEYKNVTKTNVRLTFGLLKIMSNRLRNNKEKIGHLVRNAFLELISQFDKKYTNTLKIITDYVSKIDVFKSNAKTAIKYGYSKPIIDSRVKNSYINSKGIRHPIIERIQNDTDYVPNDISIGTDSMKGMLLFGTNASGKSSLMKAVGLNIVMAQAGMFVPAEEFIFKPYRYLFTRINNNDNIFKGESSFAVEMSELRNILKRTDTSSLILGDELCSGTESISALSIFAASVDFLAKKQSSFIFATHLHELCKMKLIKDMSHCVKMFHLKVIYDKENDTLVYNRKLTEGSGEAIYGLEVCKAMDMDNDFLNTANIIRRELLEVKENLLETRNSKYNSQVIVDMCAVCNRLAEDVHHIKFQCSADNNNMIGHIQKDTKSNLVSLCKECHNRVHNGNLIIQGYIQTDKGIILDWTELKQEEFENKKKGRKKFNDSEVKIIKEYAERYSTLSNKIIMSKLETDKNIKLSNNLLNKIKNDKY